MGSRGNQRTSRLVLPKNNPEHACRPERFVLPNIIHLHAQMFEPAGGTSESAKADLLNVAALDETALAAAEFSAAWDAVQGERVAVLQSAYISNNPNPVGSKEKLDRAPGDLKYHAVHGKHHNLYRSLLYEKGYYDIFVLNTEGELIYSVYKEPDYATNFVSGQYAQSGLGKAFRAAMAQPDVVHVMDFEPYAPSNGALASFISTGIRGANGQVIGVLSFQLPGSGPIDIAFPAIGGEICLFNFRHGGDFVKLSETIAFSQASANCSQWAPCPEADRCFCSYYFNKYSCFDLPASIGNSTRTTQCEDRNDKSKYGTTCAESLLFCGDRSQSWGSQTTAEVHTCACARTHPPARPPACTHAHAHARTHTLIHSRLHAHAARARARTHARTQTRPPVPTHACTHARMHSRLHT